LITAEGLGDIYRQEFTYEELRELVRISTDGLGIKVLPSASVEYADGSDSENENGEKDDQDEEMGEAASAWLGHISQHMLKPNEVCVNGC